MSDYTDLCERITYSLANDIDHGITVSEAVGDVYAAVHPNGCDVVCQPLPDSTTHVKKIRVIMRNADKKTVALWTIQPWAVMDMEGDERLTDFIDTLGMYLDNLPQYGENEAASKVARGTADFADIVTGYVLDKQTLLDQLTRLADNPEAIPGMTADVDLFVREVDDTKIMVGLDYSGVPQALMIPIIGVDKENGCEKYVMARCVELTPGCIDDSEEPGKFNAATFNNPTISDVYNYVCWWVRNESLQFNLMDGMEWPASTPHHD